MHLSAYASQRWLGLSLLAFSMQHCTEVHAFHSCMQLSSTTIRLQSSGGYDNIIEPVDGNDATIPPATVTIDDGGSDLTDRFKYKVHALMGTYDPPPGSVDDENQNGNIIGAMLQFPTEYTFSVVGKTGGEEDVADAYANEVKAALASVLGSDAKLEMRVVPRGTKFTRVSAKVTVESASVIDTIYEELGSLEATVMKF